MERKDLMTILEGNVDLFGAAFPPRKLWAKLFLAIQPLSEYIYQSETQIFVALKAAQQLIEDAAALPEHEGEVPLRIHSCAARLQEYMLKGRKKPKKKKHALPTCPTPVEVEVTSDRGKETGFVGAPSRLKALVDILEESGVSCRRMAILIAKDPGGLEVDSKGFLIQEESHYQEKLKAKQVEREAKAQLEG